MSSGRQVCDGFYRSRSDALPSPSLLTFSTLLANLLDDFERRFTTKLYDLNRTLSGITCEVRRTAVVENVPEIVFERGVKESMGGETHCVVRTVEELLKVVPGNTLVRRHFSGDFCLSLPLLKSTACIPASTLIGLPEPPLSPNFSCSKQEVFVAVQPSPFSPHFVEVFSPFPGDADSIPSADYPVMTLACGGAEFLFPPHKPAHAAAASEEESDDVDGTVELRGVKKDDDVLRVRGDDYKVTNVTGGGLPCEVYAGADLVVFDHTFNFNARRIRASRCRPVVIRAKHGYLPFSVLADYQPIIFKFSSSAAAKKLGMGTFSMQFSNISFNSNLVCHRDSFLPPQ